MTVAHGPCDKVTSVIDGSSARPRQLSPAELLATAWSKPTMPDGFVATTMILVADVPEDELIDVLLHLARTDEWRPNAATIRRTVVGRRGLFPSEAEAGRVAKEYARKVARIRDGGPQPRYPIVHPAIADAVEAAGIEHEASFIKAYREARDRRIAQIAGEPLNQPVVFRPAHIPGADRRPPDYVWRDGGWRTETGQLIHADSGDQPTLPVAPVQAALSP